MSLSVDSRIPSFRTPTPTSDNCLVLFSRAAKPHLCMLSMPPNPPIGFLGEGLGCLRAYLRRGELTRWMVDLLVLCMRCDCDCDCDSAVLLCIAIRGSEDVTLR